MGNAAPTAPDMNASIVFAENEDYQWPESLFDECRDMADASFLMYTFSYLLHVARKSGLQGLTLDKKGRPVQTEFSPDDVGVRCLLLLFALWSFCRTSFLIRCFFLDPPVRLTCLPRFFPRTENCHGQRGRSPKGLPR
jgi:hypothetical protein